MFDGRAGGAHNLQTATTLSQAQQRLAQVGGEVYGPDWTTDVDGLGTKAFRVQWRNWNNSPQDQANLITLSPRSGGSAPKQLFVQFKHRMGRTATGGGIGNIGAFAITNELDPGGNAGRKYLLLLRAVSDLGGMGRVDVVWPGPAPVGVRTEGWYGMSTNPGNIPINRSPFNPESYVGRTFTFTYYFQAESTSGARDGIVRMWIDGTLVMEAVNIPTGTWGIDRFQFPDTFRSPKYDMTEYFWDLLVWKP
jgi:hypothetical protein